MRAFPQSGRSGPAPRGHAWLGRPPPGRAEARPSSPQAERSEVFAPLASSSLPSRPLPNACGAPPRQAGRSEVFGPLPREEEDDLI